MDHSGSPTTLHKIRAFLTLGYMAVVVTPYYALLYAIPAFRGHKSWTWSQTVSMRTAGWALQNFCPAFQDMATRPLSYNPPREELERHKVGFSRADAYPGEIKGEIGALADKLKIKTIPISVWWHGAVGLDDNNYKAAPGERTMLFLHGGAFIAGGAHPEDLTSFVPSRVPRYSETIRRTAVIEYRVSSFIPNQPGNGHPFPTALIDCISSYHYLLSLGFKASNIVIAGDSAGGNLALALARYLVVDEKMKLGPLVLISPWADLTASRSDPNSSRALNWGKDSIDLLITAPSWATRAYLGGSSAENPYISPACRTVEADFEGFPKTYLTVGTVETLLDDSRALRDKMQRVVEGGLTYEEQANMPHDIFIFSCMEPARTERVKRLVDWIDQAW